MHGPLNYHRLGTVYPRTFTRQEYKKEKKKIPVTLIIKAESRAIRFSTSNYSNLVYASLP